jgi:hypothetical protein
MSICHKCGAESTHIDPENSGKKLCASCWIDWWFEGHVEDGLLTAEEVAEEKREFLEEERKFWEEEKQNE